MNLIRNGATPLIAAHRGVSGGNIPCNCEAAFKAALYQKAEIIELDVSVSRDSELFVFHPMKESAHLNSPKLIRLLKADSVKKRRFINQDNDDTEQRVMTLDEAFELLKDKCIINIDKFWTAPKLITDCVRRHGMEEQVIIKTSDSEKDFKMVEEIAPELPYMAMVKRKDEASEKLLKRKLNFVGIEAIFETDDDEVISDEHIEWLHKNSLAIWGNAIVYDYRAIIGARHTDDVAITGDPDYGWGWYKDKGFDIIQTDWAGAVRHYFESER